MTNHFRVFACTLLAAAGVAVPHAARSQQAPAGGVSMARMGSGTAWIPEAVPQHMAHVPAGDWTLMVHGAVFVQYDRQEGPRGDDQFGSLNWGMLLAERDVAGGRFQARAMLSVDPATVTERGYPLLLQSGETYRGERIVDRQHPHDFLMEVGAQYDRAIAGPLNMSLFAGLSGEPALGPVAFMHRPSAAENPLAPLGHHWQDATHVSFGVLTAGLYTKFWKLEGSAFSGREPDEDRWDIDPIDIDSYSGRLSVSPNANWTLAAGYGYLRSPEALEPEASVWRTTGSVLHARTFGPAGQWASSFVWGRNLHEGTTTDSYLIESRISPTRRHSFFVRAERVTKSADELAIDPDAPGAPDQEQFDVTGLSLGYVFELVEGRGMSLGIGGAGVLNLVPDGLEGSYGSTTPRGAVVFVRLRPSGNAGAAAGHAHH